MFEDAASVGTKCCECENQNNQLSEKTQTDTYQVEDIRCGEGAQDTMSDLMGNNNAGGGFRGGGNSNSSSSSNGGSGGGGHRGAKKDFPVPAAAMGYQPAPTDRLLDSIVKHVFEKELSNHQSTSRRGQCLDGLNSELPEYISIQALLRLILQDHKPSLSHSLVGIWNEEGRMGPPVVQLNTKGEVGNFLFSNDRLGINSQDNFSTIRANVCVFKGKWQYEIMLGTKGVMQVGWATMNCKFSEEKGVGDTPDSYAYDGNRQRKWNVATYRYGAVWQSGDIISCTIDLDAAVVEFYRNGKSLGPAFTDIKTGPGVAYFPALSLALGESLIINFGATPFRYPQAGFLPLQAPPAVEITSANLCVNWLASLVNLAHNWHKYPELVRVQGESDLGSRGRHKTCLLLVAQHIATYLGPLLSKPYVVEACLLPAIANTAGIRLEVTHSQGEASHSQAPTSNQSSTTPQPSHGPSLDHVHSFFDLLMGSLEEHELQQCVENVILCLLTGHKQAAEDISFRGQKHSLRLLHALLSHARLRKFCLDQVLFDKVRFPSFVNIKAVDEEGLANVVPEVWWAAKEGSYFYGNKEAYDRACQNILAAVQEVEELQVSILRLLLTVTDAPRYQDTSRALFLAKFRIFLKDHAPGFRPHNAGYTPLPVILCLFHRLLTVFQQLWGEEQGGAEVEWAMQQAIKGEWMSQQGPSEGDMMWTEEQSHHHHNFWPGNEGREGVWTGQGGSAVWAGKGDGVWTSQQQGGGAGAGEVMVPPRLFYDGTLNYFDTHRLGGLESHLQKTFRKELIQNNHAKMILDIDKATAGSSSVTEMEMGQPSTSGALLGNSMAPRESCEGKNARYVNLTSGTSGTKAGQRVEQCKLTQDSLLHLLDGIILLYHIGAHKQLGKVAAQRDAMNENIAHVQEIDKKMAYCQDKDLSPALLEELKGSRQVFVGRLEEQAQQQAWVMAALHSPHKYSHLATLTSIILASLKAASAEGELFRFVPDFYVDSLTELCTALRLYFTVPPHALQSYQTLLTNVGEFLALHFCDTRIVYADSKDSLIQALAGFVCHKATLTALENMPLQSRQLMVKNLLQPYENRAWAQNNWVLVRFWKGCGFGFRYTKSPHMTNKFGPKPPNSDNTNFTQSTAPCPSSVFQRHVQEVLEGSQDISTPFLNSLLNQLNWAFSEFIGMLQEIQNASNRPERVFIDSRQLRICATCFDLALALLRVLEMVVSIAPRLFTDFSRSNAEFLLSRLCQLLCQVLNRVSGWCGCFGHVVGLEIPGLETIHHYPILTAATGILVTLLSHDLAQANPKMQAATQTLLSEPSFQISSIHRLLEDPDAAQPSPPPTHNFSAARPASSPPNNAPKFSLRNYPEDITAAEVSQVERILQHLESCTLGGQDGDGQARAGAGAASVEEDDDSLCTICYAYPASVIFTPCSHSSCRACVTQHLMNRTECFFCKAKIQVVKEQATGTIVYQAPDTADQKSS
ncbi:hypothetical protein Pcinc_009204 [Petrolisthes cinctipes]|uniref:RING-type E3 ubiquitin transferase n=1 Tax=Petrolisthes cinctipes TaxID=88211 RepID=A0AAE1G537_PETCI|nr:hypothetical protein Pcinc_009204 [Petrolisthes cinctipes]